MNFRIFSILLLLLMYFLAVKVPSQTKMSLLELCNESDEVIIATINNIESTYNYSNGRIISTISLVIDEYLKSNYLSNIREFQMIYPGGKYRDIIQIIPDAPHFNLYEKAIFFRWDGKDSKGVDVVPGIYFYNVAFQNNINISGKFLRIR